MRLIDADALMQTLGITDMDCEKCEWGEYNHCIRGGDFADACFAIENAPTIEPERKKGRWAELSHGILFHIYKCDQCGNTIDMNGVNAGRGEANFCPNCGAYMGEDT